MKQNIVDADKAGLQVNIHAIGDQANATILDYYENAEKLNGAATAAFASSMPSICGRRTSPRFGKLKVVASMQPLHIIDDGRWA